MGLANIDQLPQSSQLTGQEFVEVEQSGVNKKATTQDIANLGGASYKTYRVLLSQSSPSGSPVATVLINNTGATINWTSDGGGVYTATYNGSTFPSTTVCPPFGKFIATAGFFIISDNATVKGYYNYGLEGDGFVYLLTNDSSFTGTDINTLFGSGNVYVEINIY